MIQYLKEKISNLFKITTVVSIDDTGNYQTTVSTFLGKTQKTLAITPYGLDNNPPVGSMGATWAQGSLESNLVSLIDNPGLRPRNLLPGETAVSNYVTGDILKFETTGIVSLITALFNITGSVDVSGNITSLGNITGLNLTATALLTAANLTVTNTIAGDNINAGTGMTTPIIVIGGINFGSHTHISAIPGSPSGPPQ